MNTYTEHHAISYHSDAPAWLDEFCAVPEMQRLRGVGMNCGCEYTAFPRFLGLPRYSRFRHSVGVCLITWHFTGEIEQALAALFHDISTPSSPPRRLLSALPRRASARRRRPVRRLRARRRPGACVPTCGHRRGFCARRTEDVPHIRVRRGSLRYAAAGRASAARS